MKRKARARRGARKRVKRTRRRMRMRRARDGSFMLKRTFFKENWAFSTVTTAGFWRYYKFSLADMPSIGEITALWDSIKLCAIKVTFRPRFSSIDGNPITVASDVLTLHTMVDQDSLNNAPTGTYTAANCNSFLEGNRIKSRTLLKPLSVYFKPKVIDTGILGTGAPAGFGQPMWAPYFQSNYTGVTHNGFHAFVTDANFAGSFGNQTVDVFVTYYMKARSLR